MRFVFIKGSFAICTAGVVFWIVLLVTKSRSSPLQVLGSPSLMQLLRICLCRASISMAVLSFPQALLSFPAHLFAVPFLTSVLTEPFQVYLCLNLSQGSPRLSVQEHPVPQLLSGSLASLSRWVFAVWWSRDWNPPDFHFCLTLFLCTWKKMVFFQ